MAPEPRAVANITQQNKAAVYCQYSIWRPTQIAAHPKHLGARIGATLVLHTWGSALKHRTSPDTGRG